jgi:glycerol-3-phosphate dehydrogenase
MKFNVVVIGGVGGLILRGLTQYQLSVCLLEKAGDVVMGESKANSGIAHADFDAPVGRLKAKFNVKGNKMMESVCADLGVKFRHFKKDIKRW